MATIGALTGKPGNCSKCDAAINWNTHERTGTPAPIDATPVKGGNVVALEGGRYRMIPRAMVEPDVVRYVSHFATCPEAPSFRR